MLDSEYPHLHLEESEANAGGKGGIQGRQRRLDCNEKGQARVEWLDEAIYNVRVALTRSA